MVVRNRGNGYLVRSQRLNKRNTLKSADLEMVRVLYLLTPRHQKFYIWRRRLYGVKGRRNWYLAKWQYLIQRYILKPALMEMVEPLYLLTQRHQRNQTLPYDTQECELYQFALWRRQSIYPNAILGPSSCLLYWSALQSFNLPVYILQ